MHPRIPRSLPARPAFAAWLLLAPLGFHPALAGDPVVAPTVPPEAVVNAAPSESLWDVTFILPGWLAGVDGTLGAGGVEADVDAGFDDILDNIDMIAGGAVELKRGRFGLLLDGLYMDMSMGGDPTGPLLSDVNVEMEQVIAEATLSYRLIDSPRGWLEVLAGARYFYLKNELTLSVDNDGVREFSEELSSRVVGAAMDAVEREVRSAVPAAVAGLEDKTADLRSQVSTGIENRVNRRAAEARRFIAEQIDRGIGSRRPGIGREIAESGRVRRALSRYVEASAEAGIESARASASAAAAQARGRARSEAQRRADQAEEQLAQAIESEIKSRIPGSTISASEDWIDPFVGLQGRLNLTERFYLAARADIGGFGVGSDLTWNLFGAIGAHLGTHAALELGYRYLSIDYESDTLLFDAALDGPFIGFRWTF